VRRGTTELAERLLRDAAELARVFNEAFWVDDRSTHSASTATSGRSTRSRPNMGHLLWSGIVPPERVGAVADLLMGERLWSGWGVRNDGCRQGAYNPLVYHNGTVWPHDIR